MVETASRPVFTSTQLAEHQRSAWAEAKGVNLFEETAKPTILETPSPGGILIKLVIITGFSSTALLLYKTAIDLSTAITQGEGQIESIINHSLSNGVVPDAILTLVAGGVSLALMISNSGKRIQYEDQINNIQAKVTF